jgi:plasmid stabilization system protein ParE
MKYKLRFNNRAVVDMDEVLAHTRDEFGDRQYENYHGLIRDALAAIADDPDRPPAVKRDELHDDARTFHISRRGKHARHFFLYRVRGEVITVGRFLHDAMDLGRHLPGGYGFDDD